MSRTNLTRSSLIERARDGDCEELATLYAPLVYAMARKRGLSEVDAEDVMQQVMFELLRMLPDFEYDRSRGTFKGLLKTIVWKRSTDLLRKRRPNVGDEMLKVVPAESKDLDQMFEREWLKTHLMSALDKCRAEVKASTFASFQLTVLEERSVSETAELLNLSPNQVSQNKRRVTQRLRDKLQEADGHDA